MESVIIGNLILLWIIVSLNFLLTLALVKNANSQSRNMRGRLETLQKGEELPGFELQNINNQTISLLDFKNKSLTIVFVSPNCRPCKEYIPKLQELDSSISNRPLLIISLGDTEATKELIGELEFVNPVLSVPDDEAENFNRSFKVPGTPSYYFVDKRHRIKSGGFFTPDWYDLILQWSNEEN